jgi:RNA polymerase sigma factor (sigma-70 family)
MSNLAGENELLRASLAGNAEAFGTVVQHYQALVCAITYSATGDIGKSEELAQETFIGAWQNLRQLKDATRFRAWLCTIARNLAYTSIRNRSKDALDRAESLETAEAVEETAPGPGQAAIDKERQEMVWAAVRQIPQKYREPLVLFYRRQQSVSEVAADLGLSDSVVRQRLHRGRQLVKAQIASLVEDTLARSGPGNAFAIGVIAALPALGTQTASAAVVGLAAKGAPAAKTLVAASCSGVILGPIIGLLGGLLGTWCGIRNTKSFRERRFMIRMLLLVYVLLFVLVGLPLTLTLAGLIPPWAYWSCLGVFFVILVPLIFWSYAHQRRIQIEEGTCRQAERGLAHVPRPGVRGGFAGPIFGGTLWLLILTGLAGDWVSFSVILGCDALLFLGATALCVRHPQRYWSVALLMVCALLAMTFAAVNLRWTAWMGGYRQSSAYDPRNDVSLLTLNIIFLGLFIALLVLFATRYVRHKAIRERETSDNGE